MRSVTLWAAWTLLAAAITPSLGQSSWRAVVPCNGGYQGYESGTIVAVMPPDVPAPVGGLVAPGGGTDALVIGDTEGRTPGAYGFFVSCNLAGYIGPADTVSSAQLVLTPSSTYGVDPLSRQWTSNAGPGPAQLLVDMVRAHWCIVQHV